MVLCINTMEGWGGNILENTLYIVDVNKNKDI